MNDGKMEGMQTFDGELEKLIRSGKITKDVGLAYASNANNLALSISDMNLPGETISIEPVAPAASQSPADIPEIEGFEP